MHVRYRGCATLIDIFCTYPHLVERYELSPLNAKSTIGTRRRTAELLTRDDQKTYPTRLPIFRRRALPSSCHRYSPSCKHVRKPAACRTTVRQSPKHHRVKPLFAMTPEQFYGAACWKPGRNILFFRSSNNSFLPLEPPTNLSIDRLRSTYGGLSCSICSP